jgi:hypothetical protein
MRTFLRKNRDDVPGGSPPGSSAGPPPDVPPELEGDYPARILIDGKHVGAARVVQGAALRKSVARTLKTVAQAAAVAKLSSELPFGDVVAATKVGEVDEELDLVVEDAVGTKTLHEWASERGEDAPGHRVEVLLYEGAGKQSSTLKLTGSRVASYELAEDPAAGAAFPVRRLVLKQKEAEWLLGAAQPLGEKLAGSGGTAPPPAPAPLPCRGSFSRGVAAGVLLALASGGLFLAQEDTRPVAGRGKESPAPDCRARPDDPACRTDDPRPTARPDSDVRPIVRPPVPNPPDIPSPPREPRIVVVREPFTVTEQVVVREPFTVTERVVVREPYGVPEPYPIYIYVDDPDDPDVPVPPVPPVPTSPGCKQPPGAVPTSEAHGNHPGCAQWHSHAEPPGHRKN